jgi:hypothetical protein
MGVSRSVKSGNVLDEDEKTSLDKRSAGLCRGGFRLRLKANVVKVEECNDANWLIQSLWKKSSSRDLYPQTFGKSFTKSLSWGQVFFVPVCCVLVCAEWVDCLIRSVSALFREEAVWEEGCSASKSLLFDYSLRRGIKPSTGRGDSRGSK